MNVKKPVLFLILISFLSILFALTNFRCTGGLVKDQGIQEAQKPYRTEELPPVREVKEEFVP